MMRSRMFHRTNLALLTAAGVALAAVCFNVSQASATVLIDSNFNGGSATANTGSLGSWTITGSGTNATITDTGTESAFTNVPGGSSDVIANSSTSTLAGLSSPSLNTSSAIQMSFDFNVQSILGGNDSVVITSNNAGYNPLIVLMFSAANSGQFTWANGSSLSSTDSSSRSLKPAVGTWYRVSITSSSLTAANPTWGFSVSNTAGTTLLSDSGLAFRTTPATNEYGTITFGTNNASPATGSNYLLDNALVQTPEPASLLLFSAAGAGLLLLPRRNRSMA